MRLASDFDLHHFSVGDWLRIKAVPPIAGVPDHINAYVFDGVAVPEAVMEAEYGNGKDDHGCGGGGVPAPLTLYNCSKRNVSTPESMKCQLMPALKAEIGSLFAKAYSEGRWRWRDHRSKPNAVLLDNLMSTLMHAEAAAEVFGENFPTLAIAVDCGDEAAEGRFLDRGRGSDDATRFKRRIARYREGSADVMAFLRGRGTSLVEVSTEGESETVYRELLHKLAGKKQWRMVVAETEREQEESDVDMQKPFADVRSEVSVRS